MKWSELAQSFPAEAGPARERAIVEAVRAGYYITPQWAVRELARGPLVMTFLVATEPLRLGEPGDSVIPMVTAATAQTIADLLDARLPTPQLLDTAAATANCWIDFADLMGDVADTSTAAMERQSAKLDAAGCSDGDLVASTGKQWVISPGLLNPTALDYGKEAACNYGGHTRSPVGKDGKRPWPAQTVDLRVWQPPGFRHNCAHTDYSQLAPQLIGKLVQLSTPAGTSQLLIDEVAINPTTAALVSNEGPTPMHYPFLPVCSSLAEGGNCGGAPPDGPSPAPTPQPPPQQPPPSALRWAITLTAVVAAGIYLAYKATT
jgi:hypothetical protein